MQTSQQILDTYQKVLEEPINEEAYEILSEATRAFIDLQTKVNDLARYLLSDKFDKPNDWVNVQDIFDRLS